jgi:hypothetical protein
MDQPLRGGVVMARNLTQLWEAIQTTGHHVVIDIDQVRPDGTFNLEASHTNGSVRGSGSGELRPDPDRIFFIINWNNNTRGSYQGFFAPDNFINGSTFDVNNPSIVAGWRSNKAFPP